MELLLALFVNNIDDSNYLLLEKMQSIPLRVLLGVRVAHFVRGALARACAPIRTPRLNDELGPFLRKFVAPHLATELHEVLDFALDEGLKASAAFLQEATRRAEQASDIGTLRIC